MQSHNTFIIIDTQGRSTSSALSSPGLLVDVTQNYGSAFYSCAAGMGLGALCLAMVAPAKSGLCQRQSTQRRRGGEEGETSATQDNEQPDFLEVDFVPESSLAKEQQPQHQAAVTAGGGASGDEASVI